MAKNIKICYIVSVEMTIRFILFDALKFLKNQGYDVYIVCSPGKWLKNIKKQGIKVKIITIKRKISPIFDLIAFLRLFFYFRKEEFDIVHTHTLKPGLLGQLAAKIANVPVVINTNHGFYFQKRDSWLKRKFFIFIEKITAKCSTLILSVNKEDIKTAIEEKICTAPKIKYLGEGIDLKRFSPYKFSKNFIQRKKKLVGIFQNKNVIGIVARLVEEKGYLDFFEAFKKVLKYFPQAILLVIGLKEPEKRDAINPNIIKNYGIEKNVLFLEQRTDVDEIYPLMDIFVLPSHREGMGMSILEASAMEKPVIATDIRGCREAVNNGKTGILVPVKNSQKLAKAIIYLLENPKKAKEMGKEGRKKIIREFDQKIVFEKIKKEYQALLEEKLKVKY